MCVKSSSRPCRCATRANLAPAGSRSRLWQELGLDTFFAEALQDRRGPVAWSKVIELLAVNRLCDPQSELGIHQRWFGTTAMDTILGTDDAVAAKERRLASVASYSVGDPGSESKQTAARPKS